MPKIRLQMLRFCDTYFHYRPLWLMLRTNNVHQYPLQRGLTWQDKIQNPVGDKALYRMSII